MSLINNKKTVDLAVANTELEGLYIPDHIKEILQRGLDGETITTEDVLEMLREGEDI